MQIQNMKIFKGLVIRSKFKINIGWIKTLVGQKKKKILHRMLNFTIKGRSTLTKAET